ncbi:MAG: hypothetical protein IPK82_14735 [Polyangiaceae bacterium]|nr:hypothetical protein [Polyangiaceae bacterium]
MKSGIGSPTRVGLLVSLALPAMMGCDIIVNIGEYCVVGKDEGCGTGASGGAGGTSTTGSTTTNGGGGTGGMPTSSSGGIGGAAPCTPGMMQTCYGGPANTEGVGACKAGQQTCDENGEWGVCEGEVQPVAETCGTMADEDCDAYECALWAAAYGDSDFQSPSDVVIDADGNIIVVGVFKGTMTFGAVELSAAGGYDLFIAKLQPDGGVAWAKQFGNSADQLPASAAVDGDGNIFLAGPLTGAVNFDGMSLSSSGGTDAFVAKLNPQGTTAWAKRLGDAANQTANDLDVDSDGNVLVIGEFAGTIMLQTTVTASNGTDLWVAKFNGSDGSIISQFVLDDKTAQPFARALQIAAGPAGTWLMAGRHGANTSIGTSTFPTGGVFLAKFDGNNTSTWQKSFPLNASTAVLVDDASNVWVGGDFYNTIQIGTNSLNSGGGADLAIIRVEGATGNVGWAKSFGGSGDEYEPRLALSSSGGAYFVVQTNGSMIDFGGETLVGKGLTDFCVVALNSDGSHSWSRIIGDATAQANPFIATDSTLKYLALTATSSGTVKFGEKEVTSQGNDVLVARLAP